jgi:hypothetical protein
MPRIVDMETTFADCYKRPEMMGMVDIHVGGKIGEDLYHWGHILLRDKAHALQLFDALKDFLQE